MLLRTATIYMFYFLMELALKVFVYDKKNLSQVLFCMNFLPFIIAETSWYSTLYYQDFVWSWIEELL